MSRAIRPVGHEDHLSLVEHLDELRTRIIVCLVAVVAAFAFCFWQNHTLLHLIGNPYAKETKGQVAKCKGYQGQIFCADRAVEAQNAYLQALGRAVAAHSSPALAGQIAAKAKQAAAAQQPLPKKVPGNTLVTIGIGEPFTATITVTFYFALVLSLPIILFELYSFVIPAFSPTERRVAFPVMLSIPGLFACGVLFGYFVVLPAAVHFLQNFNAGSFEQFVQASSYYQFAALIMLAMGVIFQVPLFVIALSRAGIVTPRQLRKNRRIAIVVAALIAAVLPGDVVTMLLETLPIIVLYEIGILVVSVLERRDARRARAQQLSAAASTVAQPPPPMPSDNAL
jgi:sec-independent protein translocase protein TatC